MSKAVWLCEMCGKIHDTEAKATFCEKDHKRLIKEPVIVDFKFRPYEYYPSELYVTFDKEASAWYKLSFLD